LTAWRSSAFTFVPWPHRAAISSGEYLRVRACMCVCVRVCADVCECAWACVRVCLHVRAGVGRALCVCLFVCPYPVRVSASSCALFCKQNNTIDSTVRNHRIHRTRKTTQRHGPSELLRGSERPQLYD
jgi:hypothetical protein